MDVKDVYSFVYSCDLDVNVKIKIGSLDGVVPLPQFKDLNEDEDLSQMFSGVYQRPCPELQVTCQLFADGKPLSLPVKTSFKAFSSRICWNEWLTLPLGYADLPRNTIVALTVLDTSGRCLGQNGRSLGGTVMPLFGHHGTYAQGIHDLRLWPHKEPDTSSPFGNTPGASSDQNNEMTRLARIHKKYREGHVPHVDWLDRLAFREVEMRNEIEKRRSQNMYLMLEFPRVHHDGVEFAIIYFEKGGEDPLLTKAPAEVVRIYDPEIERENLVEAKYHRLARSVRSGGLERELKPNATTRDQLNSIVGYPPTKQLSSEEQDLLWKFRFSLSTQKKALTKFLKCVRWSSDSEVREALELMHRWLPIDSEDALELLSPQFQHPAVRKYAVKRLNSASDDDLLLYLLQLVQALRYESFEEIKKEYDRTIAAKSESHLPETTTEQEPSEPIEEAFPKPQEEDVQKQENSQTVEASQADKDMDLTSFLIQRSCLNPVFASYLYWYLFVEREDAQSPNKAKTTVDLYTTVMERLGGALQQGGESTKRLRSLLARQQRFVERLDQLVGTVNKESTNRKVKIEKMKELLSNSESISAKFNFTKFDPLPLPVDPEVWVDGIIAENVYLFKSALTPARLSFRRFDNSHYVAIFKLGDDLRQDQLILQMFSLMDRLLRRENLDLKLTPYKVIATSPRHGFVQYIESKSIGDILQKEKSLQGYLRQQAPSDSTPFGIDAEVMDTYVRSCAGYSVITYLLGVGDRHLDNLMLTTKGHLFHIDFGFILGRDPKPLPPPIKLSSEMVEAMGGMNSQHFHEFKKFCYAAFLHLRRHANVVLNLFSLMIDSNIPDIALEPDKAVKKVLEKFVLDLNDEEAVAYLEEIIEASVNAMMPKINEKLHNWAKYWKS